ncbi:MAG: hypothetical protein NT154_08270, partial [Verrucomicrobia bacterium]|nr:hypothetical protein [Verrucomicrobiota bacterium]
MKRRNFLRNVGATIVINTALFPHISRLFKLERDGCWLRRESNLWTYEPPPRVATAGCTILSRTISSVEDKRISVSNSQFARALPAGLTWNCLRVGIRHIM